MTLSSPTYPNFIVSASTSQVPGYIPQDVADMYRCMDVIADEIGRDRISGFFLTGYSLGGTQSAFLAELDTRERRFGFRKVLLLNPAVSLMTSAVRLDRLLSDNVADRAEAAKTVSGLIRELSEAYRSSDHVNFRRRISLCPASQQAHLRAGAQDSHRCRLSSLPGVHGLHE